MHDLEWSDILILSPIVFLAIGASLGIGVGILIGWLIT